jgi:hypothetical protein
MKYAAIFLLLFMLIAPVSSNGEQANEPSLRKLESSEPSIRIQGIHELSGG